jgi:hypothetical protein
MRGKEQEESMKTVLTYSASIVAGYLVAALPFVVVWAGYHIPEPVIFWWLIPTFLAVAFVARGGK